MQRIGTHRSSELVRSLTLLRTFLLASALILAVGAVALSSTLSNGLREQALDDNARDTSAFANAVLAPSLVRGNSLVASPRALRRLRTTVRFPDDVRGVNVWSRDGRLLFSTTQPGRVGKRVTRGPELRSTIGTRKPSAELVDPAGKARPVVKTWAPIFSAGGRPVGAAEVTLDRRVVDQAVADYPHTIWGWVGIVLGVLWLVLALLVRGASSRLRRQNEDLQTRSRELTESTRQLEETLLETIETLNAAVEARDPYTAGHSQRVRRVALAIGQELGLSTKQLGALGTAALFHDIGKIGMPDAILTKPETLSPAEAAVMREHVTRGAEIVSPISSLQDSMPGIRHHHERWDGLGYPDGLSSDEIPLDAAIIGLADAWDAMTTDRPYAVALSLNEALMQIRAGRGKQFNPAIVDAFAEVAKRHPSAILPPEAPTATVAVV